MKRTTSPLFWILAAVGAVTAVPNAPQDMQLRRLSLMNCELDIRPKQANPADDPQANIYWEDQGDRVQFTIVVPENDFLVSGDVDGNREMNLLAEDDMGNPVFNRVWLEIDDSTTPPVMQFWRQTDGGPTEKVNVSYSGELDPLASIHEPYMVEVRYPVANKERVRVLVENKGLTSGFTIRNF